MRRARAGGGAASPAARRRREEPRRSRLLHRGLPPSFFLPFSLSLGRLHTQPLPSPSPHTPFPKHPGSPRRRAAPARGSGGIQTPLHNITTTARRDWRPCGGEARVRRAPIGHAAALARVLAPPSRRGRGGAQEAATRGAGGPGGRASGRAPRARWAEPGREVGRDRSRVPGNGPGLHVEMECLGSTQPGVNKAAGAGARGAPGLMLLP